MKKIAIAMFNTASMDDEILKRDNVFVIDLHIFFKEEEFFGNAVDVVRHYDKTNILPSTSQPSTQEIVDKYEEILKDYDDLIVICPSSNLSGTLNNARLATEVIECSGRVHLVHARSVTLTEYACGIRALNLIDEGMDVVDIVNDLNDYAMHFETYIQPGSLEYMKHGGRVNMTQLVIGTLLTLKILVRHVEPVAEPYKKLRGMKSVLKQIDLELDKNVEEIYYASMTDKQDDKVYLAFKEMASKYNLEVKHVGLPSNIVICQFGDNTFGFCLKLKEIPKDFIKAEEAI